MFKVESEATMKFRIYRTSNPKGFGAVTPFSQATLESSTEILQVWSGVPGDVPESHKSAWLAVGQNHRVADGIHLRDCIESEWSVEIDALDQLMQLIALVGQVVITEDAIEIYDDYRE